jgi:hypothetical protein
MSTPVVSDEVLGMIGICIIVPLSIFTTYYLSRYVDRFCSTDIDATIIRRIEAMRMNGRSGRVKVVLDGMEPEERLRVLERVLDCKPYSKELGAQLKMERKKEEEDKRLIKELANAARTNVKATDNDNDKDKDKDSEDVETGQAQAISSGGKNYSHRDDDEDAESIISTTSNNNNQLQNMEEGHQDESDDDDDEEMNILDRVWKEFGQKKNQKNKWVSLGGLAPTNNETAVDNSANTTTATDEVTETCAICMEDYEEDQDVIIGHNCVHMYHKECLLKWMSTKHDSCPYCRTYVFDVPTFRKKAEDILGAERYRELAEQDDPEVGAGSTSGSSTGDDDEISPQQAGSVD